MLPNKIGQVEEASYKKQIGKRLKQSLLYIIFFLLFYTVFNLITPYYIKDPSKLDGPIDSRVSHCKFFDSSYVQDAKKGGYNSEGYFQVYLPLDLAFPILYTIMFLTILAVYKKNRFCKRARYFYTLARYLVFAGMIFDYLENFTFSLYLKSPIELSSLVAFFTTIKTFLFVLNFVVFAVSFIYASFIFFKPKKDKLIA